MNILLIGEVYSDNLGDPVICDTVKFLIEKNFPNANISFLDLQARKGLKCSVSKDNLVAKNKKTVVKFKILKLITALGVDMQYIILSKREETYISYFETILNKCDYDIAIFAGGQLIKDTFVCQSKTIVDFLNKKNIPVVFNACGYGEIPSKKLNVLAKKYLNYENVVHISTRDDKEKIQMLILDNNKQVINNYDPALWVKEVYSINKTESDVIGLGVMFDKKVSLDKTLRFWNDLIDELEQNNLKWNIFCNGADRDYHLCKYILHKRNISEEKIDQYLSNCPLKPEDLVSSISKYKAIISFRLHSHIIATSLNIPGIAITWDSKLKFFYENINHPERCIQMNEKPKNIVYLLKDAISQGVDVNIVNQQKNVSETILCDNIKLYSKS